MYWPFTNEDAWANTSVVVPELGGSVVEDDAPPAVVADDVDPLPGTPTIPLKLVPVISSTPSGPRALDATRVAGVTSSEPIWAASACPFVPYSISVAASRPPAR